MRMQPVRITLLWLGFAGVLFTLLGLSGWQVQRGLEKQQLQLTFLQRQQLPPLELTEASKLSPQLRDGRRLQLQGEALMQQWVVLDNRIYQGTVGYEWLMPLRTPIGVVLLNVGWAPAQPQRHQMQPPSLPAGSLSNPLLAQLHQPKALLRLAQDNLTEPGWPLRTQAIDTQLLQPYFAETLLDFEARLIAPPDWPLRTHWKPVVQTSERHYGYAVQWLLMAMAWLWVGWRVNKRARE